ncbi:MAG TPA: MarR family transcriptional regulator [Actinospica sp.]|nr:MarR family transcriptional regulator [Actinospica sp.]
MPRRDLAAMIVPLGRALTNAEIPTLTAHGLSMWGYVVLLRLQTPPVRTQAALATEIGADKTRIIPVLDQLQSDGLIIRKPHPEDRRVNLIAITPLGRDRCAAAQAAIQANEERILAAAGAPQADIQAFLRVLSTLSGQDPETFQP